ncbi:IS3 family transposase [Ureibacillus thermophilus]|uniref:IS3 family transposase n=1 Tax=Ureibacillus thermophilus TaxID=367743 RepID=UPI0036112FED
MSSCNTMHLQLHNCVFFHCKTQQSMPRIGNCWDNACIESFFGKLKTELPAFSVPETKTAVSEYVLYYNEIRSQLKLRMSTIKYRKLKIA